jgi:hypothetical protein
MNFWHVLGTIWLVLGTLILGASALGTFAAACDIREDFVGTVFICFCGGLLTLGTTICLTLLLTWGLN